MKTFHIYYIKRILLYFTLCLLVFGTLYIAIDLISNYRSYGETLAEILGNFSLKLPLIFYQMQAISLFLANILVLSLIYSGQEHLILATSGISLTRIYTPLLLITFALSLLFCAVYDHMAPKVFIAQHMRNYGEDLEEKFRFSFINSKVWYQEGQEIYHIGYISPDSGQVEDVQIFFFSPSFELQKYIQAQRAIVVGKIWNFEQGLVVMYDNHRPVFSRQFDQMASTLNQDLGNLKKIQFDPRQLRLGQLATHLYQRRFKTSDVAKYETDLYQRIVFSFFPLIMFCVGAPVIRLRRRHASLMFNAVMAFLLSIGFWTVFRLLTAMGSSGKLPPLIAVLGAPVMFAVLGVWLWQRKK